MGFTQRAEFDKLTKVMVHSPGFETFLGTLDPEANLFDSSFNFDEAYTEHVNFKDALREEGIQVYDMWDQLAKNPAFEEMVLDYIDLRRLDNNTQQRALESARGMNARSKLNILLTKPALVRHYGGNRSENRSEITCSDVLGNMYFQRDQQFLTDKGMIVARLAKPSRRTEACITKLALEALEGVNIVHEVEAPETFEGGDFIPFGDFALFGSGYYDPEIGKLKGRSTKGAALTIMDSGAVGYDEVAVIQAPMQYMDQVKKRVDKSTEMEIMHIDTWMNTPAKGLLLACEELMPHTYVSVYNKVNNNYLFENLTTLDKYMGEKGYEIIPISLDQQSRGMSNFLTIDDGKIMSRVYPTSESNADAEQNEFRKLLSEYDNIDIVPESLVLNSVVRGYGGVHCMTCTLERV